MKTIQLIALFFAVCNALVAQNNLHVLSFKSLPNDLDARVNYPVTDQNGETCALIKVVTPENGFSWDGGQLGITSVIKKTGEYWLYVPHGAKKLTVKHDLLGVLRDYLYPEKIAEASVYEMVLHAGEVQTKVISKEIPGIWTIINTEPKGADIYIDEKYLGTTPFQTKLLPGEHVYSLKKELYKASAGKVNLSATENKFELSKVLEPNFGALSISSVPEQGADIYIDGLKTGLKTPHTFDTLLSGEKTITARKALYEPRTEKVSISPGNNQKLEIKLIPAYGTVTIKSSADSRIYIDNLEKGKKEVTERLMPGLHTVTVVNDKKHSFSEPFNIIGGETTELTVKPPEVYGSLDLVSNPWDADIFLDGEKAGKTPKTFDKLPAGEYKLKLVKENFQPIEETVIVEENQTTVFNTTLEVGIYASKNDVQPTESYDEFKEVNVFKSISRGFEKIGLTPYIAAETFAGRLGVLHNNVGYHVTIGGEIPDGMFTTMGAVSLGLVKTQKFRWSMYPTAGIQHIYSYSSDWYSYEEKEYYGFALGAGTDVMIKRLYFNFDLYWDKESYAHSFIGIGYVF